jgi:hypothetical protein
VVATFSLCGWLASELRGADDQGAFEKSARAQVGQQGSGAAVEDAAPVSVVADEILMAIPVWPDLSGGRIFRPAEDLDEANSTFYESTCEEALPSEGADFGMV